ncbi:tetratricopeptide repeat protein [Streptomyces sp. NPDC059396]|uniref:tetratricopeptide repeat protein n=1 Tax=Streptomyces sp. NPDC059396 TaxID=3346819 RepID=UPI0036C24CE0
MRAEAGDHPRAVAALEDVVADHVRVLGPDHHDTLNIEGILIDLGSKAGNPADAVAAYREFLAKLSRLRGPSHVDVFPQRSTFSTLLAEAGDFAGAVAACEELLTDCLRLWGADHCGTLAVRAQLADTRGRSGGEVAVTSAAFEELLTDCLRLLGTTAPITLVVRAYLDALREHTSDPTTRHPVLNDLYTARRRPLAEAQTADVIGDAARVEAARISNDATRHAPPFWFAVPATRPLVPENGGSEPLAEVAPGTWYLAVEQRGQAILVQSQEGMRGTLQDTSGIQYG